MPGVCPVLAHSDNRCMQCVRPQVLQKLLCGQSLLQRLCRGCGLGDDDDNRQRQRRLERQTAATVGAAGAAAGAEAAAAVGAAAGVAG